MGRTVAVPIVPSVKEGRDGNVTACLLSQERSVESGVEPDGGEAFHEAVRPFCMRPDRAARMFRALLLPRTIPVVCRSYRRPPAFAANP